MNRQQKKRIREWVNALRSGKYKQGRSYLRNNADEYCCLGVACDIYDPKRWEKAASRWMYLEGSSQNDVTLPEEVRDWLGLDPETDDPRVRYRGRTLGLTILNDGSTDLGIQPHTFAEIADLIEAEFLS